MLKNVSSFREEEIVYFLFLTFKGRIQNRIRICIKR
jgi:hypothetical protein